MKSELANKDAGILKTVGLKNCHAYVVLSVHEVILDNGELEYLLHLRNPTGNIYCKADEVWKGDWSPLSPKWTNKVRKQVNYMITEEEIGDELKKAR